MGKSEARVGDFVEVHRDKIIYEGRLLEPLEDEKDVILLKLGNGYNIGLKKSDVREIKVLEKKKESSKEKSFKRDGSKPRIVFVVTGGTIASKLDPKSGAVKWLESPEDLLRVYPDIFKLVDVEKVEVPFLKGSENLDYKDWQKLAKVIGNYLNDSQIKGVIVTHGTDTLHYTSAALSFFLGRVNKPVVLTYSQRSIDRASSDARLNLVCSARAALSEIAQVMVVGHASTNDDFCYAINGAKVRKLHSSRRDAFKAVNTKPYAKITEGKIEILNEHNIRSKEKVKVDMKFEEKVALVKFYPGAKADILDYYFDKGYKGVVVEALGLGQVATSESMNSWSKKIKDVVSKGMVVCFAPQTVYGRLDPYVYSTGRELVKSGVIFLEDMLSETAFVKLGFVLAHEKWDVKEKMLENLYGEINDRLEE